MAYQSEKWKLLCSGVVNDGAPGNRLAAVYQKGSELKRVATAVDGPLIVSEATFDLDSISGPNDYWELVASGVVDSNANGVNLVMLFQNDGKVATLRTAANTGFKLGAEELVL
ncbi:MAG: hypothetical protein V4681_03055 [Patescibacteria group bacterium]